MFLGPAFVCKTDSLCISLKSTVSPFSLTYEYATFAGLFDKQLIRFFNCSAGKELEGA
jgi:hypothetical protein